MNPNLSNCALLQLPEGAIEYSIGNSRFDNQPRKGVAKDFESFADVFDQNRAPQKGTLYLTPPFGGDGKRCNANCSPHKFLAFDLDGGISGALEDDQFAEICFQMSAWRGFRYETSSSVYGNRRARFILNLDQPVSREEGMQIRAFIRGLMPKYGNWDKSCDNPAQPLYMPGPSVHLVRFGFEPVSAGRVLSLIPPKPIKPLSIHPVPEGSGSVLGNLKALNYWQSDLGSGKHRIVCPWGDTEHSDGRLEAFYFEPGESNGLAGGFHCFHSHCGHRNIGHLMLQLDLEMSTNAA